MIPSRSQWHCQRIALIQQIVADAYKIPSDHMREPSNRGMGRSGRNPRSISGPRQVAMYLASKESRHSLSRIGDFFGNRDHSTVIFAIQQVEMRALKDKEFRSKVTTLRQQILSDISFSFMKNRPVSYLDVGA